MSPVLRISTLVLVGLLTLWAIPFTHASLSWLDEHTFKILNHSLAWGYPWQVFWGMLNHPLENKIGLAFAVSIHLIFWLRSPADQKLELGLKLLFFWGCFELVYAVKNTIFEVWFGIKRASPSLVFPDETLKLSELLQNSKIKDSSRSSFPGGHALFIIYWGLLSWKLIPSPQRVWILGLSFFLCIPRLVSGAHWLSDVLFTACMAVVLLELANYAWDRLYALKRFKTA